MSATKAKVRIRWAARRDGVAHGHTPTGIRALCGEPEIRDRDAWPAIRKCMACRAVAEDLGWRP